VLLAITDNVVQVGLVVASRLVITGRVLPWRCHDQNIGDDSSVSPLPKNNREGVG